MTLGLIRLTKPCGARVLVAAEDIASVLEIRPLGEIAGCSQVNLKPHGANLIVTETLDAIERIHDHFVLRAMPREAVIPGKDSS